MGNRKQGICMADGGITQESPEQLMSRMAAKYGAPTGSTQQPQPQSTQQAPQQPKSNHLGIMSMLKGRSAQIDKVVNGYADGGIAGHIKFEGKGGPRDDQIPVKVAGQEINVSNKEQALIIPAKTAANAQAMEMIKKIIAESNDGRQPDMGHGDSNFAEGGLLDDEARKMNYQAVTGVQAPAPTPQPAAQPDSGGWSLGKSGPGATLQVTTGDAARLPAPAVQQGIATMRNQLATPQPAAASGSNYVGNGPTDPDTNGRQAIAAQSNAVQRGIETMRGQFNQTPAPSENELASAAENERIKSLYPAGTFDKPAASPLAAPVTPGASSAVPATAKPQGAFNTEPFAANKGVMGIADGVDASFITGKAGAMPDSSGGGFTAGKTSYNVNPSNQEGVTKVTATGKNPLYTNIRAEDAVAGLKNQSVDGDSQEGIARFARANAIRQEMIDSQPQGGIGILGDGGIEAANAEKTARWRQDDLIEKASRGNQAAVGAAINANASTANAATNAAANASAEAGRAGIAMRGQDMASKNEAARLAGNPVENQLKQAQTQGIMATTESAQMLAGIQKKALAGDPQAMASYLALTGKKPNAATDRFMTVQGGEEVGPDGMTKIKKPSGVFDAQTQRFVSMNDGQQQGPSQADLEHTAKKHGMTVDQVKAKLAQQQGAK